MHSENEEKTDDEYVASTFVTALKEQMPSKEMPKCPFCGGNQYTTPEQVATIPVGSRFKGLSVGQTAPCAMIVCTRCGHVDYFALGILGLLPNVGKKGGQNGQANDND